MCRKELVDLPEEEERDEGEEGEEDDDYSMSIWGTINDNDEEQQKLTVRQVHEAIKKQGYTEADLISFILYYYDNQVNIKEEVEEKSDKLIVLLDKICYKQIAVDYRDNRSYANVLSGVERTEEPGSGPKIQAR